MVNPTKGAPKSIAEAEAELQDAIKAAGGTVTKEDLEGRYVRAEFRVPAKLPGAAASVGDVLQPCGRRVA